MDPKQANEGADAFLRNCILLIEDNADAVALTRRAVQRVDASIRLVVTDRPDEAMDAFLGIGKHARENTWPPFMVIFDLRVGNHSGLELLRRFGTDPATKDAALVVASASATGEEAAVLLGDDSPADAFLTKPVSAAKMAELIERFWPKR